MSLNGSLREISLANLIRLNGQAGRSGRLSLTSRQELGEIYFSDGQVIHARRGARVGIDAVAEMMSWDEGTFVLDADVSTLERSITLKWKELLMEGMKRSAFLVAPKIEKREWIESLNALKKIEGVLGYWAVAADGQLIATKLPEGDGTREAQVTILLGTAASQIQEALNFGKFERGLTTLASERLIIFKQPEGYVGLVISEQATLSAVAKEATGVLRG